MLSLRLKPIKSGAVRENGLLIVYRLVFIDFNSRIVLGVFFQHDTIFTGLRRAHNGTDKGLFGSLFPACCWLIRFRRWFITLLEMSANVAHLWRYWAMQLMPFKHPLCSPRHFLLCFSPISVYIAQSFRTWFLRLVQLIFSINLNIKWIIWAQFTNSFVCIIIMATQLT